MFLGLPARPLFSRSDSYLGRSLRGPDRQPNNVSNPPTTQISANPTPPSPNAPKISLRVAGTFTIEMNPRMDSATQSRVLNPDDQRKQYAKRLPYLSSSKAENRQESFPDRQCCVVGPVGPDPVALNFLASGGLDQLLFFQWWAYLVELPRPHRHAGGHVLWTVYRRRQGSVSKPSETFQNRRSARHRSSSRQSSEFRLSS